MTRAKRLTKGIGIRIPLSFPLKQPHFHLFYIFVGHKRFQLNKGLKNKLKNSELHVKITKELDKELILFKIQVLFHEIICYIIIFYIHIK